LPFPTHECSRVLALTRNFFRLQHFSRMGVGSGATPLDFEI